MKVSVPCVINAIPKFIAALAVVFAACIANNFQSKMTAITMLSQREESESRLRATMFGTLIDPFTQKTEDNKEIHPEHERLLVELLALNFHEHFDLKPLMNHMDQRLNAMGDTIKRNSVRSIARRIASRQIAMLFHQKMTDTTNTEIARLDRITVTEDPILKNTSAQNIFLFGQTIVKESPDKKYQLKFAVVDPDWDKEKVSISGAIFSAQDSIPKNEDIAMDFTVSWYDFPFTDYILLKDGNRFSIVLSTWSKEQRTVDLKLIWFPKNYYAPRERPVNFSYYQEALNLKMD